MALAESLGMSNFELVSAVLAALGVLLNVILLLVVFGQFRQVHRQIDQGQAHDRSAQDAVAADHARRKKQATVDFYLTTIDKRSAPGVQLPYDRDGLAIAIFTEHIGQQHSDEVKALMEYLDLFETLAAGVRLDVFDVDVIEGIATGQIQDMAKFYTPWIFERRRHLDSRPGTTTGASTLYSELLDLADALAARHNRYAQLHGTTDRSGS